MRAAVAQADDRVRVGKHLRAGVQVLVGIVREWREQQRLAVFLEQAVVGQLGRIGAGAPGQRRDRAFRARVVARRVAQRKDVVELVQALAQRRILALAQQLRAQGRVPHAAHPLIQRKLGDGLVAGAVREDIAAALQPQQHAYPARRDLRADGQAVGRRLRRQGQQPTPPVLVAVLLHQRERQRPAGFLHQAAHHAELGLQHVRIVEVDDDLQHAAAGIGQPHGDAGQLFLGRAQRRHRVAGDRAVIDRARSREADRAMAHGLGRQAAHPRDVLGRGHLEPQRALAHDVHAQRRVRQLRAEIDVVLDPFGRAQEVGKRLPGPVQPFVQRDAGDVFHAFHQLDQIAAIGRAHRREPDPAVAHHHRGHAVPAGWSQAGIPDDLPVVVRMDVDEAWRDDLAARVDLGGRARRDVADLGDQGAAHPDVGDPGRAAMPVHEQSAADDKIKCLFVVHFFLD